MFAPHATLPAVHSPPCPGPSGSRHEYPFAQSEHPVAVDDEWRPDGHAAHGFHVLPLLW